MNNLPNITRFLVNDAVLRLVDTEVDIPLTRFIIRFGLNAIPSAELVPALGTSLNGMPDSKLSDVRERDKARVVLTLDGKERVLFEGYVASVQADDNTGLITDQYSAQITLQHNAVKLAGMPSVSFVYSDLGSSLESMHILKTHEPLLGVIPDRNKSVYSIAGYVRYLFDKEGEQSAFYPGRVLRFITQNLMANYNSAMGTAAEIGDMLRVYDPANLTKIVPVSSQMAKLIAERYVGNWLNGNCWSAITDCCEYLFLTVVPFNTGFYIADTYSLDRKPAISLGTGEFTRMSTNRVSRLQETGAFLDRKGVSNGVMLISPMRSGHGADDIFTFPSINKGRGQVKEAKRYYYRREFPDWIQPIQDLLNGKFLGAQDRDPTDEEIRQLTKRHNIDFSKMGVKGIREYFAKVGQPLAKSVYAQITMKQITVSIDTPYREDLMPGTVVELKNPEDGSFSFIGDSMYGMVTRTVVACDMTAERGTLGVSVEISNVRNSEDNADTDFTEDGNPLYEGRWTGIDIYGNFLDKDYVDGFKAPAAPTTQATNSATGTVDTIPVVAGNAPALV